MHVHIHTYIVIVHVFAWLCLAAVARVVFCKSFRRVVGMSEMLKYLHSRPGKRLTSKREVAPLPRQATPLLPPSVSTYSSYAVALSLSP